MSTEPEPRETTFRASLAAMRQQQAENHAGRPRTQPALTRCNSCLQLVAFLEGDLCEACAASP